MKENRQVFFRVESNDFLELFTVLQDKRKGRRMASFFAYEFYKEKPLLTWRAKEVSFVERVMGVEPSDRTA